MVECIRSTIKEVAAPLGHACNEQARTTGRPVDGEQLVLDAVLQTAAYFAKVDGRILDGESTFMAKLVLTIFHGVRRFSSDDLNRNVRDTMHRNDGPQMPALFQILGYLQAYDKHFGTCSAYLAKGIFYRLANAICKADGNVTEQEKLALLDFKKRLYGSTLDVVDRYAQAVYVDVVVEHANAAPFTEASQKEPAKAVAATAGENTEQLMLELKELIGLDAVKKDVATLVNLLKIQLLRRERGLPVAPVSHHLVFSGNPGTGKTTVARLLARVYASLGVLPIGQLIETDRSGMVAGYAGQTAIKTTAVASSAIGGILFVDEAYALSQAESKDQFGQEAIDTLVKLMEDRREDLIVVVAGYEEKMVTFIESNPGLRSRFNQYINFEDYDPDQLVAIFENFAQKSQYQITQAARERLRALFQKQFMSRDDSFGNARLARNIFEASIRNQANRIASLNNISLEVLTTIEENDL